VDRYNQIAMKLIGTVWLGLALTAQIVFHPSLSSPPGVGGLLAGAVLLNESPLTSQDLPGEMQAPYKAWLETYSERGKPIKSPRWLVA